MYTIQERMKNKNISKVFLCLADYNEMTSSSFTCFCSLSRFGGAHVGNRFPKQRYYNGISVGSWFFLFHSLTFALPVNIIACFVFYCHKSTNDSNCRGEIKEVRKKKNGWEEGLRQEIDSKSIEKWLSLNLMIVFCYQIFVLISYENYVKQHILKLYDIRTVKRKLNVPSSMSSGFKLEPNSIRISGKTKILNNRIFFDYFMIHQSYNFTEYTRQKWKTIHSGERRKTKGNIDN